MQRKTIIISVIALALTVQVASAQIVNVAKLDAKKEQGLHTSIELKNRTTSGNTQVKSFAAKTNFEYLVDRHWWLLLVDRHYESVADKLALDRSMQHLRYRYLLSPKLEVENFLQNARDPFKRVKSRKLIGLGPRFKPFSEYEWFVGIAAMHESESVDAGGEQKQYQTQQWRSSMYTSIHLKVNEKLSLDGSAYLQPSGISTNDYRMISETGLNVELIKHLSWRLSFQTSYDSKPADMVRKFDQKFEQSLAIRF